MNITLLLPSLILPKVSQKMEVFTLKISETILNDYGRGYRQKGCDTWQLESMAIDRNGLTITLRCLVCKDACEVFLTTDVLASVAQCVPCTLRSGV